MKAGDKVIYRGKPAVIRSERRGLLTLRIKGERKLTLAGVNEVTKAEAQ